MEAAPLVPRHAASLLQEALSDTRVVVLNGARQVGKSTLASLAVDRSRLGDRFVAGVVLHTGTQSLPFGDRMRALPMAALWRAAP